MKKFLIVISVFSLFLFELFLFQILEAYLDFLSFYNPIQTFLISRTPLLSKIMLEILYHIVFL